MAHTTIIYAALGRVLYVFACSPAGLECLQTTVLPRKVQYGWPTRDRRLLYLASSGPVGAAGPAHHLHVLDVAPDGRLNLRPGSIEMENRPIHLTLDAGERHLLVACCDPPEVMVHRLSADGAIGPEVARLGPELGTTVHQVRVTPAGGVAVVPACAHHPTGAVPGQLDLFRYRDGSLTPLQRIGADPDRAAPWLGVKHGAHGFSPRHVDFHPDRPWMYLCVETQGEVWLYDYDEDGISARPRHIADTLEGAVRGPSAQMASAIHVHPYGRFLYVGNRAKDTVDFGGQQVFAGGVNDVAIFALDAADGTPRLIGRVETGGIFPRTMGISDCGRWLVVGNEMPGLIRNGDGIRQVWPGLVLFAVDEGDGQLTPVARHDLPGTDDVCFWVDSFGPPQG